MTNQITGSNFINFDKNTFNKTAKRLYKALSENHSPYTLSKTQELLS